MRKIIVSIITILLIATVVFLGCYSMLMSDVDKVYHVENAEYITGEFTYSGWMKNGLFDGDGTLRFNRGGFFVGEFKEGKFEGHGEYSDAEGRLIYSGDFINGKFDGQGLFISPEGWVYEGAFKEGLFEGEGKYVNVKGQTYEGSFKRGLFDGEGKMTDGDLIVYGRWEEGEQIELYDY